MLVTIMNKAHFVIEIDKYKFIPYKEQEIKVGSCDAVFRLIRSNKNLRVGKPSVENKYYIKKHKLTTGYDYNFCYDIISQHAGEAYKYVIDSFSMPVLKHLQNENSGFVNRPAPGKNGKGINIRFFSSMRINEQGKCPVGPYDVFFSHGIADKNYWIGKKIKDFKYAFCPGPTWKKRMIKTGYKGEIFEIGYPKLDPIFNNEIAKTKKDKPYIAWLPTHGYANKDKGRSSFPKFLEYTSKIPNDYIFSNGLHPTSKLHKKQKHFPTMEEFVNADVVIADAGSTLYEAWSLGIPVIFPDWICKKSVLNHFSLDNLEHQIYSKQIGYHAKDFKQMLALIEKALQDGMKENSKEFIEGIFPEKYRGKSGELASKALINIKENMI